MKWLDKLLPKKKKEVVEQTNDEKVIEKKEKMKVQMVGNDGISRERKILSKEINEDGVTVIVHVDTPIQ